MKMELSQTLVLHRLAFGARPELDPSGRVVYVPNTSGTPYLVFDTHRDAPPGFAVKVNATKKTYIVQRRVGDAVIKAKVGEVPAERRRAFVGHEAGDDVHQADYMRAWTASELAELFPGLRWNRWLQLDSIRPLLK